MLVICLSNEYMQNLCVCMLKAGVRNNVRQKMCVICMGPEHTQSVPFIVRKHNANPRAWVSSRHGSQASSPHGSVHGTHRSSWQSCSLSCFKNFHSGSGSLLSSLFKSGMSTTGSEELHVYRHDAGVSSEQLSQLIALEELLKVVTCAMVKLNLDRPNEQQEIVHRKLDNHFLISNQAQPHCTSHSSWISTPRCVCQIWGLLRKSPDPSMEAQGFEGEQGFLAPSPLINESASPQNLRQSSYLEIAGPLLLVPKRPKEAKPTLNIEKMIALSDYLAAW